MTGFRHFTILDLERNQIEQINSNLFLYLNKLKKLNLDGNKMNSNEVKNIQNNLPCKDSLVSADYSNGGWVDYLNCQGMGQDFYTDCLDSNF